MLGQMSQDRFFGIWVIEGHVGVGQAIERVTVARFDSVKPCLLDWKAKAGMVEGNQGTNAGEIHAVRVKSCAGGAGCQGHGLSGTVEVEDRAGFAAWANGMDALAGMQAVMQGRCREDPGAARRRDRRGRRDCITWGGWHWREEIGSGCAWDQFLMHSMRRRSRKAWLGCREGKVPEPGTVLFPPTLEDTLAVRVNNKDTCLGEGDGVA